MLSSLPSVDNLRIYLGYNQMVTVRPGVTNRWKSIIGKPIDRSISIDDYQLIDINGYRSIDDLSIIRKFFPDVIDGHRFYRYISTRSSSSTGLSYFLSRLTDFRLCNHANRFKFGPN